ALRGGEGLSLEGREAWTNRGGWRYCAPIIQIDRPHHAPAGSRKGSAGSRRRQPPEDRGGAMKEPIGRLTSEVRSRGSALPRVLLATLITWGAAPITWSQAIKGTLLGTITDTQGAVLPGANVTIIEVGTNIGRSTVTNQS